MITISRYGTENFAQREYRRFSDILRAGGDSNTTSYIEFVDGTKWTYPLRLFTLNRVLGEFKASVLFAEVAAMKAIQDPNKEFHEQLYSASLKLDPRNLDVIASLEALGKSSETSPWRELYDEYRRDNNEDN